MKAKAPTCPPLIFNAYKPVGMSSQKVVSHFKKNLPNGYGKIGHLGTLDPFAEGILPIAIAGAARLNNLFHDNFSKTYIAYGVLGKQTPTGDNESDFSQEDDSDHFKNTVSSFSEEFIEELISKEFLGDYLQSPHKYSAAKFEGRPLHEWARLGVEIKKEKVLRKVYSIKVIEFDFPKLVIEFKVSSGTYIRSLFSECAQKLGTIGYLEKLIRSQIGPLDIRQSIIQDRWPNKEVNYFSNGASLENIFKFERIEVDLNEHDLLKQGRSIQKNGDSLYYWCFYKENLLCLLRRENNELKIQNNFLQMYE